MCKVASGYIGLDTGKWMDLILNPVRGVNVVKYANEESVSPLQCSLIQWCDTSNPLDMHCRYHVWFIVVTYGGFFVLCAILMFACSLFCGPFI